MISRGSYLTEYVEIPLPNGKSIKAYVFDGEYYYNLGDLCKSILKRRNLNDIRIDNSLKFELMRDTKRGRRVSLFTDKYGLFEIIFGMRGEESLELKKYILDNVDLVSEPNLGGQRNTIPTPP